MHQKQDQNFSTAYQGEHKMKKSIIVKFQFEAIHCWPECPIDDVSFLRSPHRHTFHVTARRPVTHNDRDVEIIMLKREMLRDPVVLKYDLGRMSCEDLAEHFINSYKLDACEVLEDGENGAYLEREN